MAIFFRGMDIDERVDLTRAMMHSGTVLEWSDFALPGPVVDKHSTGGVGDNVSLMLAPMLAACGVYVPMISGRGLGHTGGTLDKLEAIPGYVAKPDNAICSARSCERSAARSSARPTMLAPADRRLYAIRDVTATVESIPLITASILSKKLAAGLQSLVMDVKTRQRRLHDYARSAQKIWRAASSRSPTGAGLPTVSLITDMNEPLASAAGNAVEVTNAVEFSDRREARCAAIGGDGGALRRTRWSLRGASRQTSRPAARRCGARSTAARRRKNSSAWSPRSAARAISDRACARYFANRAADRRAAPPPALRLCRSAIDAREVGLAVVELGGGRARAADAIDPAVGLTELAGLGAEVAADAPLALVHARDEGAAARAIARLAARLSDRRRAAAARPGGDRADRR